MTYVEIPMYSSRGPRRVLGSVFAIYVMRSDKVDASAFRALLSVNLHDVNSAWSGTFLRYVRESLNKRYVDIQRVS